MANPSKAKGTDFEMRCLRLLRSWGYNTERLALSGSEDEGDLVIREQDGRFCVIECKNEKEITIAAYVNEAKRERAKFAEHRGLDIRNVDWFVVVAARGKNESEAYVITTMAEAFQ